MHLCFVCTSKCLIAHVLRKIFRAFEGPTYFIVWFLAFSSNIPRDSWCLIIIDVLNFICSLAVLTDIFQYFAEH